MNITLVPLGDHSALCLPAARPACLARAALAFAALAIITACSPDQVPRAWSHESERQPTTIVRDIDELERIRWAEPRRCDADGECPTGSHCDGSSATCTWECLADTQCGSGRVCDDAGTCVAAFLTRAAAGSACTVDRTQLLALNSADPALACADDSGCPCGSYCDQGIGGICRIQCLTDNPPAEFTCAIGLTCSSLGRCQPSAGAGAQPVLTLAIAPADLNSDGVPDTAVITADTATAVQVVQAQVRIQIDSANLRTAASAATVRYHFRGIDDASLPARPLDPPIDPNLVPKVACSSGGTPASQCDLAGGWTFSGSSLLSDTRTIYVQMPKTTTRTTWTLEAMSSLAPQPAEAIVQAAPTFGDVAGHYHGTISWLGSTQSANQPAVALPIDVYRAAGPHGRMAIVEPSGTIFPGGKIEIINSWLSTTKFPWLTADANVYTAAIRDLVPTDFPATEQVSRSYQLQFSGSSALVRLDLTRLGDIDVPSCGAGQQSCAAGSSCSKYMQLCLPGGDTPYEIGFISSPTTTTLPSSQVAAWKDAVDALVQANPQVLGGSGAERLERAYCARNPDNAHPPLDTLPPSFARDPDLLGVSGDRYCRGDDGPRQQRTFDFVNLDHEVTTTQSGTFELLEACRKDLLVKPGDDGSLLASKPCVSLARFFLALRANASADGTTASALPDIGQRVIAQVLRQWLNLTTYVAETTIKDRDYDDVIGASGGAASERFAAALDQVESNLRVLLDPSVRPQFTIGDPYHSMSQPDYRVDPRPISRWTFNAGGPPVLDAEGQNPLLMTGAVLTGGTLSALEIPDEPQNCNLANPVTMRDPGRYAISAVVRFVPQNGATVTLVDVAPLTLTAATTDQGQHLSLTLSDGSRTTSFTLPWRQVLPFGNSDLIAVVAEPGNYRAYAGGTSVAASSPAEPQWPTAGIVKLGLQIPAAKSCASWDLYIPGDGLGVKFNNWDEALGPIQNSSFFNGQSEYQPWVDSQCIGWRASRRNELLAGVPSGVPTWATNQFAVLGTVNTIINVTHFERHEVSLTFRCGVHIDHYPSQNIGSAPVCGVDTSTPMVSWDEVSLWDRPLTFREYSAMQTRYAGNSNNETLPPRATPPTGEQAAAVPVHMVEAANAELDLVASYLDAAQAEISAQCTAGQPPDALRTALVRAGRNVRVALLIAAEATKVAATADSAAPWRKRYDAARTQLQAKLAVATTALQGATACRNPLGITEADIPLFVGTPDGSAPIEKFYASSRYLVTLALGSDPFGPHVGGAIGTAMAFQADAQSAYVNARQSAFQASLDGDNKARRVQALRASYESQLVKLCGAPVGGGALLAGFFAGTIDASNCYLASPSCSSATPLADQPPSCLRGEIGERLVALQTAIIDGNAAQGAASRAEEAWGTQVTYCAHVQASQQHRLDAYDAHIAALHELQARQEDLGMISSVLNSISRVATAGFSGGFAAAGVTAILAADDLLLQQSLQDVANDIQSENDAYHRAEILRDGDDAVKACYLSADLQRFSIAEASDKVTQAAARVQAARIALASAGNAVTGIVRAASGDLAVEDTLGRAPPQFHYWLDDKITKYQTAMHYARRLAYLTVLSFDYESQSKSTATRTAVLTARDPAALQSALKTIWGGNRAVGGSAGVGDSNDNPIVLSLREDILRLQPLTTGSGKTAQELLREQLASDSSKYFEGEGRDRRYIGRAIRFALKPGGWNLAFCAERLWRITPSVGFEGDPVKFTSVKLYHRNTFASQTCGKDPGTLFSTGIRANQNVLVDESPVVFQAPENYTKLAIDGPPQAFPDDMKHLPPGPASAMSGRGPYGDYILVFPKCEAADNCREGDGYTDAALKRLTDVQLRVDLVFQTN